MIATDCYFICNLQLYGAAEMHQLLKQEMHLAFRLTVSNSVT